MTLIRGQIRPRLTGLPSVWHCFMAGMISTARFNTPWRSVATLTAPRPQPARSWGCGPDSSASRRCRSSRCPTITQIKRAHSCPRNVRSASRPKRSCVSLSASSSQTEANESLSAANPATACNSSRRDSSSRYRKKFTARKTKAVDNGKSDHCWPSSLPTRTSFCSSSHSTDCDDESIAAMWRQPKSPS